MAALTPAELVLTPRTDTDFFDRYERIHDEHVASDGAHARRARCETQEALGGLADRGLVFDICVNGQWAGIVAAEPDARRGVRGATVIELLLAFECRGLGLGKHLSVLLAQALSMDDDDCLIRAIHADNVAAYRAALSAGRVDVGGEIRIPV